ncbi:Auxin-induced protein [Macleaya cordata]|uniref:Auxin-induced protein n=1 Tax=Macleaya cordata TaxID=56857 RepID=A0A200R007_MACCD|nr:Auxin-induced protein [Macleaya cordata]
MRSSKKLSEIIGKWRKRRKGHFVVYAKEGKRFVVPLYYLNHPIFRVLLEMAEEEFGSTIHGPLQVPCEEELMDYIITLLRKNWQLDIEKAFVSMNTCRGASVSSF